MILFRNDFRPESSVQFIYGFDDADRDTANQVQNAVADNIEQVLENSQKSFEALKHDITRNINEKLTVDLIDNNGILKVRNDAGKEFQYVTEQSSLRYDGELRNENGHIFLKVSGLGTNNKPFTGWVSSEYLKGDSLTENITPASPETEETTEPEAEAEPTAQQNEEAERKAQEALEVQESARKALDPLPEIDFAVLETQPLTSVQTLSAVLLTLKQQYEDYLDTYPEDTAIAEKNESLSALVEKVNEIEAGMIDAEEKRKEKEAEERLSKELDTYLGSFLKEVDGTTLSLDSKILLEAWSKMKTIEGKPVLDVGSNDSLWLNTNIAQPDWDNKTFVRLTAADFTEEKIKAFAERLEQDTAQQENILAAAQELETSGVLQEFRAVAGEGEEATKEKYEKAKKILEGKTGQELQAYTAALKPVLQDLEMKIFSFGYERDQQRGTALSGEIEDNQNVWNNMDDYASGKTLAHLLENFKDADWSDANEEKMAAQMTDMVGKKLDKMKQWLDTSVDPNADGYERIKRIYLEDAKAFAQVTLNIGTRYEDSDFRDIGKGAEHLSGAMEGMSYEEAFEWTKKLMASIDDNNYQSSGVKEAYQNVAAVCQNHLMQKLAAERAQIAPGDTQAIERNVQQALACAKMFTDRGGYDIDSDLTSPDWAASMLKDSIDFTDLSMAYMEKQMQKENPLKKAIEEKKEGALTYLQDPRIQANPQSAEFAAQATELLNQETYDMADLAQQFAYVNMIECMRDGTRFDPENCQAEAGAMMTEFIENSQKEFYEFLDDTAGAGNFDAAELATIENATGMPFTESQKEALKLLGDIEGFGFFDFSDKTWKTAAEVAKVVAIIAAAIAVGVATGGAGFVVMAAAMGATSAASASLLYQKGFDDSADFVKVYGKEFAIGAAGGAIGKLAQGGRAAFIASRSGVIGSRSAAEIMLKGGPRAAALAQQLDDAATIGARLRHGSYAGELAMDATGGILADTSLNTAFDGGAFMDNLQTAFKNPGSYMGLGMGVGMKISPAVWRRFKNADPEQLNAVNGALKDIQHSRAKLRDLGVLDRVDADLKAGRIQNVDEYMNLNRDAFPEGAENHIRSLLMGQNDFRIHLESLGVGQTLRDIALPTVKNTVEFVERSAKSVSGYIKSMSDTLLTGNLTQNLKDKIADSYLLATGTLAIMQKKIASLPTGALRDAWEVKYAQSKSAVAKAFYQAYEAGVSFVGKGKEGFGVKKGVENAKEALQKIRSILPNGQTFSNLSVSAQKIVLDSLALGRDSIAFLGRQIAKLNPGRLREVLKKQVKEAEDELNHVKEDIYKSVFNCKTGDEFTVDGFEFRIKAIEGDDVTYTVNQKGKGEVEVTATRKDFETYFKNALEGDSAKPAPKPAESFEAHYKAGDEFTVDGLEFRITSIDGDEVTYTVNNTRLEGTEMDSFGERVIRKPVEVTATREDFETYFKNALEENSAKPAPKPAASSEPEYAEGTYNKTEDIENLLRNPLKPGDEIISGSGTRRVITGQNENGEYTMVTYKNGEIIDETMAWDASNASIVREIRRSGSTRADSAMRDVNYSKKDTFKTRSEIEWRLERGLEQGDEIVSQTGTRRVVLGQNPDNTYNFITYKNGQVYQEALTFDLEHADVVRNINRGGGNAAREAAADFRNKQQAENRARQEPPRQPEAAKPKENTTGIPEIKYPKTAQEAAAILGVPLNAGEAEIKKAYRALSRQHHPDLAGYTAGTPEYDVSTENFKSINEANELLLKALKAAA